MSILNIPYFKVEEMKSESTTYTVNVIKLKDGNFNVMLSYDKVFGNKVVKQYNKGITYFADLKRDAKDIAEMYIETLKEFNIDVNAEINFIRIK